MIFDDAVCKLKHTMVVAQSPRVYGFLSECVRVCVCDVVFALCGCGCVGVCVCELHDCFICECHCKSCVRAM